MKIKSDRINFTHKYKKLSLPEFHTVRWLDSVYIIGNLYEVYFIAQNIFHTRYGQGKALLVKIELKRIKDLTDDFIRADADCDRATFIQMMEYWYSKKADWAGENSFVQILYFRKEGLP